MKILSWPLITMAVTALSIGAPLGAQEADADEPIEEIIITGSRIKQDPLEARTPVQILTELDINRSGQVSLADFVQRLPISCGVSEFVNTPSATGTWLAISSN